VVDPVEGVSFSANGYAAAHAQAVPPRGDAPQGAPTAPKPPSAPSAPPSGGQAFVPDFARGVSAAYVLDWRDPASQQVLVQVPMRTALAQVAGADPSVVVIGTHVDTAV